MALPALLKTARTASSPQPTAQHSAEKEPSPGALAVSAHSLSKHFGKLKAVDGIELQIREGELFGLLGPNGSGKTTTIHMLTTLTRPTHGVAIVAGCDVRAEPVAVRRQIGLVFQESALDRNLTIEENLHFAAALYKMPIALARERIAELLQLFNLDEKRRTPVGKLSGGMRRAVDVARGVLHRPRVLFLDEPTLGLDPVNRLALWQFIARLRREERITVLVTTHYLEEAAGCDQVAFLNAGIIIGRGAPQQLINQFGAYVLEIESPDPDEISEHLRSRLGAGLRTGTSVSFRVTEEHFSLAALEAEIDRRVQAMHLRRPNLNDVYLWLVHGAFDGQEQER
jgi:ABC-2 type transport system ATP-binding protein